MTPPRPTRSQSFIVEHQDKSVYTGVLALSAPFPATHDSRIAGAFPSGLPCPSPDPSRDALVYGTIAFRNTTGDFSSQLRAKFSLSGGKHNRPYPLEIGIGFADKPTCTKEFGKTRFAKIRPQFTTPQWGPVPLEILIKGWYSPKHPRGDKKILSGYSLTFAVSGIARSSGSLLRFQTRGGELSKWSVAPVDLLHDRP